MNIRKQPWQWPLALAFTLAMSACVTINIYFPAAAAEKAADKIIDEVWQEGQGTKPADDKPADKSAQ
ncbi:hypothetical protein [Chitinivorax sp. B]|uniref:hypothetical protein n=1 Tax=Chitinivorax sp. B TaxID=2502235 RepID=UPI0010F66571|nr:hypothetical protein [Chitinivorax sp. B]